LLEKTDASNKKRIEGKRGRGKLPDGRSDYLARETVSDFQEERDKKEDLGKGRS